MKDLSIFNFFHSPPNDYSYEFEEFNSRLISIWLVCHIKFDYNHGESTRTIWGFYHPKKKEYYTPINSKKVGKKVDIDNTTNYTSMQIKLTPLEVCFS